jgi:hypothetical protein
VWECAGNEEKKERDVDAREERERATSNEQRATREKGGM